jgi:cbb3-type cytochrome oxidase subunit 3
VSAQDWATIALSGTTLAGSAVAFALGRRGRRASASQSEADAIESLTASVLTQGQQINQLNASLWEAHRLLRLSDERAAGAETRAAAAELRAATLEHELINLRAEVSGLRAQAARPAALS